MILKAINNEKLGEIWRFTRIPNDDALKRVDKNCQKKSIMLNKVSRILLRHYP